MDSANQTQQTLVYADGYSYTEFFQISEEPGTPSANKLISVFHALFSPDHQVALTTTPSAPAGLPSFNATNSPLA